MRLLPFMKAKRGFQFAGGGFENSGGGGGGGGGSLPDITTTEQLAGFKWGNKDVYVIGIDATSDTTITSDFTIDRCIVTGVCSKGTDRLPINTYYSNDFYAYAYISNTGSGVKLYFSKANGLSGATFHAIVYYTKNS